MTLFKYELRATGKTQQAIADVVGVVQSVVSDVLSEKPVITEKTDKKREQVGYRITNYTKPEVAAERFASTWANAAFDQQQIPPSPSKTVTNLCL